MTELKLTKQEKLKAANAKAKELREEQKVLRDELNESKTERIEAKKVQATSRKEVRESKSDLRELSAKVYDVFSKGTSEEIIALADSITESAAELAGSVRKFGEASESLEDL